MSCKPQDIKRKDILNPKTLTLILNDVQLTQDRLMHSFGQDFRYLGGTWRSLLSLYVTESSLRSNTVVRDMPSEKRKQKKLMLICGVPAYHLQSMNIELRELI